MVTVLQTWRGTDRCELQVAEIRKFVHVGNCKCRLEVILSGIMCRKTQRRNTGLDSERRFVSVTRMNWTYIHSLFYIRSELVFVIATTKEEYTNIAMMDVV